ncbi:MAG: ABC transporter permease [Anaerolineae bacterium]
MKVWIIALNEYTTNVRRTGFILMTLLVPAIGLIVLLIATFVGGKAGQFINNQIEGQTKPVGVVDEYGAFTPILPQFAQDFTMFPSEDAARSAIASHQVTTVMVIPPDYLATGKVRVLSSDTELRTIAAVDTDLTRAFLTSQLLNGKLDETLYKRVENPLTIERVDLSQATGSSGRTPGTSEVIGSILIPYFIGILLVMSIFTSSGYLMQSVTEEKTSRVIEILLSSVSAEVMLAGKIIGMGALGLTQVLFWLASAGLLSFGSMNLMGSALPIMNQPGILILVVVYFLLGFMIYAVLMGIAGALGTTQQESQQISGLLSLFAALPFFFAGFVVQNPNMGIARVLSFFPFTSSTMMLLRIPMGRVPAVDIIVSILITVICIPLLLWAGAKVFRLGLLVYGKRPSMAVIWRAIKQA